jgi:hypothetical protein
MSKRVPGVGHFMKMGKSVLETVTDSNLNDTIGHYLQKNILKISQMSEKVLINILMMKSYIISKQIFGTKSKLCPFPY